MFHPSRRSGASRALGAVVGILGIVYLVSLATYDVTNDVQTTSLTSWRIAETGTPWLEGYDYSEWEQGAFKLWVDEAPNGHLVGTRSPGPILAAVPAYFVARLLGADGYAIAPGSITAALLTTAAMALLFLALRHRIGPPTAAAATLALGLTTPVWSVSADALYTHPVTLFGLGGMAYAASRERWLLVGLFGGVAVWGRLHTALIVAAFGLGIALMRRSPRIAVQIGAVSGAALGLATLWGRWMYGTWSPAGGYDVSAYADRAVGSTDVSTQLINHLGHWVAPDRGLLIWTPVLLVLAPAVVKNWRSLPDWPQWLAIGGTGYLLVQGQLNGFSGGSGFYGYRLTLEFLVCLFPAYALSIPNASRWLRRILGPVLGLQFGVISIGAAGEGGMLGESVIWTDNSFLHAVRTVPMAAMWPILTMLLGALIGSILLRRAELLAAAAKERGDLPGSDVGARDELDRV